MTDWRQGRVASRCGLSTKETVGVRSEMYPPLLLLLILLLLLLLLLLPLLVSDTMKHICASSVTRTVVSRRTLFSQQIARCSSTVPRDQQGQMALVFVYAAASAYIHWRAPSATDTDICVGFALRYLDEPARRPYRVHILLPSLSRASGLPAS